MSNTELTATVAEKLGAAIASRNAAAIRELYAEDITVWHPAFGGQMGKKENVDLLAKLFSITSLLGYHDVRRLIIDDKIVQQHYLTGKFADGTNMPRLEICMIITVRDGLIQRIDEYFDASTFSVVWERIAAV